MSTAITETPYEVTVNETEITVTTTVAQTAAGIRYTPTGTIAATNVQAAIDELATETAGDVSAHLGDTVDAHDASAVSYLGSTNLAATDVEAALDELDTEKAGLALANTFTANQVISGTLTSGNIAAPRAVFTGATYDAFVFDSLVTADGFSRVTMNANGEIRWGSGAGATDTNLYRAGANSLATDDSFSALDVTATGVNGLVSNLVQGRSQGLTVQYEELGADPSAPSANRALVYAKDNGAGKTQLVVRFPTGAVQVIATEP